MNAKHYKLASTILIAGMSLSLISTADLNKLTPPPSLDTHPSPKAVSKTHPYGQHLCQEPNFYCHTPKSGETWKQLLPDKRERELTMRLNRTNLELTNHKRIVIPKNFDDITLNSLSPFPLYITPPSRDSLFVNLHEQAFAAYNRSGALIHWGPISSGKSWCEDNNAACNTYPGSFKIYRKQGAACKSSVYPKKTNGGAPMPWCMHYKGGYAIHGSTLPGHPASHGCIRVFYDDAKWLNQNFLKIGSPIIITE